MTGAQIGLAGRPSARVILDRIRGESRDESEKGGLVRAAVHADRASAARVRRDLALARLAGTRGVDRPRRPRHRNRPRGAADFGEWVAIQCKCYEDRHTLGKGEIDKFLGGSQQPVFRLRWIVATCRWGPNAERAIQNAHPQVTQVDFREYPDIQVEEHDAKRPVQEPWPLQAEAIEDAVDGLVNHDRGRLIMACGMGKTFTALRIAEQLVEDGQRILFAAPTIALVSQARREWLRQTTRDLSCIVVCSDPTAGGRNENEDIRISELECPVSTDPAEIARSLDGAGPTRVVFCTYHSLGRVTEAQALHDAPAFDLAIADEAHRTTGAFVGTRGLNGARKVDFQEFHDDVRPHARKCLYMTATPRMYSLRSRGRLAERGIDVVDMGDYGVYGPELHRLPFAKAVNHGRLFDYRVIVLGVSEASVTPGLRQRLEDLDASTKRKQVPTTNDMTHVLDVSLAVNGVTEGKALEQPGKLCPVITNNVLNEDG